MSRSLSRGTLLAPSDRTLLPFWLFNRTPSACRWQHWSWMWLEEFRKARKIYDPGKMIFFIWDKCCHPTICLRLMEPYWPLLHWNAWLMWVADGAGFESLQIFFLIASEPLSLISSFQIIFSVSFSFCKSAQVNYNSVSCKLQWRQFFLSAIFFLCRAELAASDQRLPHRGESQVVSGRFPRPVLRRRRDSAQDRTGDFRLRERPETKSLARFPVS